MDKNRMSLRVASKFIQASRSNTDFQAHLENALVRYVDFGVKSIKDRSRSAKFYLMPFRAKTKGQMKIHIRDKLENRTMGVLIATVSIEGKVDMELTSTLGTVYTDSISNMNTTTNQLATYLAKYIEDNLDETYYVDPKDIRLAKKRSKKNSPKSTI